MSEWGDVLETPSRPRVAGMTLTTGGPIGEPIEFGPPGVYRMLFGRRHVVAGETPGIGL